MSSSRETNRPRHWRAVQPSRGMNRAEAANYIGLGTTKFDQLVADGRMPAPKQVDGRKIWDRHALDIAFDELPTIDQANPWDNAFAP